jgi:hypothetical protein
MKIEIRGIPHHKVPVADILPNPHRDLKLNPPNQERIEGLLESFERSGFWDNIVVRKHPTREDKYELAYGHNRWSALRSKNVVVDTITIPVAKLSDWEMYCAMVDENELQGAITPAIAMENVNTGCDLVEKALKQIGPEGTWEEFNQAIGTAMSADITLRDKHDGGFEQARNNYFDGEGIGNRFLLGFLPGRMRNHTIVTVTNARYAEVRARTAQRKAKEKEAEATAARKNGQEEKAEKLDAEAQKMHDTADRLSKGTISRDILLMFDAVRTMTDFATAIRHLRIPPEKHLAAAKMILKANVKEERIEKELSVWWDVESGAAAKRAKQAKQQAEYEKMQKLIKSKDFTSFLLKIADDLKGVEERIDIATKYVHLADARGRKVVHDKIAPLAKKLDALIRRAEHPVTDSEVTPSQMMLTHRR